MQALVQELGRGGLSRTETGTYNKPSRLCRVVKTYSHIGGAFWSWWGLGADIRRECVRLFVCLSQHLSWPQQRQWDGSDTCVHPPASRSEFS